MVQVLNTVVVSGKDMPVGLRCDFDEEVCHSVALVNIKTRDLVTLFI